MAAFLSTDGQIKTQFFYDKNKRLKRHTGIDLQIKLDSCLVTKKDKNIVYPKEPNANTRLLYMAALEQWKYQESTIWMLKQLMNLKLYLDNLNIQG